MKKLLVIAGVFVVGGALEAGACSAGCVEYNGTCACDARPESVLEAKPSDELPPRSRVPAYERGEVKAAEPKSLIYRIPDDPFAGKDAGLVNGGVPSRP